MAFSWTKERINYLRENAGKLRAQEMAEGLGTNVTVIRNMAARLKLSLRVRGFTQEDVEVIHKLYASPENITVRNIAKQTGLSQGTVSYILYSGRDKKPLCYERVEYIEFETINGKKVRVEKALIDTIRTPPEPRDQGAYDISLQDGTRFMARNLHIFEQITARKTRGGWRKLARD
ncbi:hypothetical protein OP853_003495 [Salmonella enterica]|nr:MarR family transcriptional regulator [Salmonella enterica]EKC7220986.1 hypothetical protein [Salmonella enterica]ELC8789595.1 hypothetical protein [Salmonella enterica]